MPFAFLSRPSRARVSHVLLRALNLAAYAVLLAALALGLLGGLAIFARKHLPEFSSFAAPFLVYAALLTGAVATTLRWPKSRRGGGWLLAALVGGWGILIVASHPSYPQLADRLYFLNFIRHWVAGGADALRALSRWDYDFILWVGRAWPFPYPLAALFPAHQVATLQWTQVLLWLTFLGVCWRIFRQLLPLRSARLAAVITALSPVLNWSVLDYGYQHQTALFVATAVYLALSLGRRPKTPAWLAGWAVLMGLNLFILHLQSGHDLLALAMLAVWLGYRVALTGFRRGQGRMLGATAAALLLYALLCAPFDRQREAHDEGRLGSHFIAHMAMGWNLHTWGEYYGPYMAADRDAPPEEKAPLMRKLIADGIRAEPVKSLLALPVVKVVKLMQVGAASGIEEGLAEGGYAQARQTFRGQRLAYSLFIGCFGLVGLWYIPRRTWVAAIPASLLFCAYLFAYTLFSETSPRYYIYTHFLTSALAAQGLTALAQCRAQSARPV